MFWWNKRKIDISWVSSDSRYSEKITLKGQKMTVIFQLKTVLILNKQNKISIPVNNKILIPGNTLNF